MEISRIVELVKYCIMAIPVVMILAAILVFVRVPKQKMNRQDDSRGKKVKRSIPMIVFLSLIYVGCFLCVRYVESRLEGEIVIGFNYAEASRGLNPNSTRFNTYDIIDDDVLGKAIGTGELGALSVDELRRTLSVEPLEAGDSVSAEQYYVATEYVLRYKSSLKTIGLKGENVVSTVAKAYYDDFQEQYARKTNVLELDFTELDELDYLDAVDLLKKYSSDISEFLGMCGLENDSYVNESGETFASLSAKVGNLSEVELERLESYILTKGLSKNAQQQISKIGYENLIRDISYEKAVASYKVQLEAIDIYERDMASVVLVPTRDEEGEFYMGRTKVGADNFASQADSASKNASSVKNSVSSNKYAISQLKNSAATAAEYSVADSMIDSLKSSLQTYAAKGIDMVTAFDTKTKGTFLAFSFEETGVFSKSNVRNYIILFAGMFVAAGLLTAAVPDKKRSRK